jgi:hypothetical protein
VLIGGGLSFSSHSTTMNSVPWGAAAH